MVWPSSFSKLSDLLSGFTCASAVGNVCSICLEVNILRRKQSETFSTQTLSDKRSFPWNEAYLASYISLE